MMGNLNEIVTLNCNAPVIRLMAIERKREIEREREKERERKRQMSHPSHRMHKNSD